jgi:hypothetical protein
VEGGDGLLLGGRRAGLASERWIGGWRFDWVDFAGVLRGRGLGGRGGVDRGGGIKEGNASWYDCQSGMLSGIK